VVTDKPGGLAGAAGKEMVKGQSPEFRYGVRTCNWMISKGREGDRVTQWCVWGGRIRGKVH
jgi:hypothetical protein